MKNKPIREILYMMLTKKNNRGNNPRGEDGRFIKKSCYHDPYSLVSLGGFYTCSLCGKGIKANTKEPNIVDHELRIQKLEKQVAKLNDINEI